MPAPAGDGEVRRVWVEGHLDQAADRSGNPGILRAEANPLTPRHVREELPHGQLREGQLP